MTAVSLDSQGKRNSTDKKRSRPSDGINITKSMRNTIQHNNPHYRPDTTTPKRQCFASPKILFQKQYHFLFHRTPFCSSFLIAQRTPLCKMQRGAIIFTNLDEHPENAAHHLLLGETYTAIEQDRHQNLPTKYYVPDAILELLLFFFRDKNWLHEQAQYLLAYCLVLLLVW